MEATNSDNMDVFVCSPTL